MVGLELNEIQFVRSVFNPPLTVLTATLMLLDLKGLEENPHLKLLVD